ncbi:hypothetical protein [Rhodococcus sp. IEGM 1408]|uniref:DUF6414 family protein n=1 Tax=Rhodococcus sp. IEGM 1408 TaxID=3082220 RepID=UPI00295544A6|nr:hypothetical protein [Rhodococcus sp. IEGM 1408]MDV8002832.1 hypothetical protein [Rhodococcus sp. IEGM 1408]
MSGFRIPVYLDLDVLVPLANYHGIEVLVDVEVSERMLRSGAANGGGKLRTGLIDAEAGGARTTESERTRSRVIRDAPASALNRLVDALFKSGDVRTDTSDVARRNVVEIDADWEISPATDAGALLTSLFGMAAQNPAMLQLASPPPELLAAIMRPAEQGTVILSRDSNNDDEAAVIVLANRENLVGTKTADDLEGDRTVLGIVESFVPEGKDFEFAKHLLTGIPRAFRRQTNAVDLLRSVVTQVGSDVDADSLVIPGPVVLVRAVAVY